MPLMTCNRCGTTLCIDEDPSGETRHLTGACGGRFIRLDLRRRGKRAIRKSMPRVRRIPDGCHRKRVR